MLSAELFKSCLYSVVIVRKNTVYTHIKKLLCKLSFICLAEVADDAVFVTAVYHSLVVGVPADKLHLVKAVLNSSFHHNVVALARSLTVGGVRQSFSHFKESVCVGGHKVYVAHAIVPLDK